jgi:hypothetical protein
LKKNGSTRWSLKSDQLRRVGGISDIHCRIPTPPNLSIFRGPSNLTASFGLADPELLERRSNITWMCG